MTRHRLAVLSTIAGLLGAAMVLVVLSRTGNGPQHPAAERQEASKGHARQPMPDLVRDCDSRVEGPRLIPRPREDLVAGPIVFYGLRGWGRAAQENPSDAFRSRAGEYAPVKTVTDVAADSIVTVAIAAPDQRRAALLYRWRGGRRTFGFRHLEGQRVVQFRSCPANHRRFRGQRRVGPRTQYNGGFLFAGPQCLHLDVSLDGIRKAQRYVVPIGRPAVECSPR